MAIYTLGAGQTYTNLAALNAFLSGRTFTEDETVLVTGVVNDTGMQTLGENFTPNGYKLILRNATNEYLSAGRLYPLGSRAELRVSASYEAGFRINGAVVVAGLQLCVTGANASTEILIGGGAVVRNSIVYRTGGNGFMVDTIGSVTSWFDNCLFLTTGAASGVRGQIGAGAALKFRNCTHIGTGTGTGLVSLYSGLSATNCIVGGYATDVSGTNNGGSNNATYSASFSDASFATNGVTSVTSSAFVSVAVGSEDYSLAAGSPLLNVGATIAGLVVDAFGNARPQGALYDIGASEYLVVAATATTLAGPASGTNGVASTNFTAGANGTITGTVTITPSDAASGGTFTPTTVAISSGTPTATFTYTPASTGAKTISISDDGGLTDAVSIVYTSNAAGDTTPPTQTGTVTSSAITTSGFTLTWPAGADNVAVTGYEYSTNNGATYTPVGNVLTTAVTGLTQNTLYQTAVRAFDAAGNVSTPALLLNVTTATASDTTAPTQAGTVTVGTVTSTSIQITWPAGADNTAVASYETSPDGTTWTDRGNVLTHTFPGLTASTSYTFRVRAKDAAGNVSTPALQVTQSTAAVATGVITSPVLKNNTGTVLASETAVTVNVYHPTTGALVVQKTGATSSAGGVVTVTDALIITGTSYAYEIVLAANGRGLPTATAT